MNKQMNEWFRASKKYLWPVNFLNSPTIDKCGEKLILDAVCNTKPYMYPTTATGMLKGLKPVMKPVQICCCVKSQKKITNQNAIKSCIQCCTDITSASYSV